MCTKLGWLVHHDATHDISISSARQTVRPQITMITHKQKSNHRAQTIKCWLPSVVPDELAHLSISASGTVTSTSGGFWRSDQNRTTCCQFRTCCAAPQSLWRGVAGTVTELKPCTGPGEALHGNTGLSPLPEHWGGLRRDAADVTPCAARRSCECVCARRWIHLVSQFSLRIPELRWVPGGQAAGISKKKKERICDYIIYNYFRMLEGQGCND